MKFVVSHFIVVEAGQGRSQPLRKRHHFFPMPLAFSMPITKKNWVCEDILKAEKIVNRFNFSEKGFKYDAYFKDQILKKKMDHSYRIFKKVNRRAESFPHAQEYTWGEKPITVWCSNDYLGMSAHPKVKAAVK